MEIKELAQALAEITQEEINELTNVLLNDYGLGADITLRSIGIVPTVEIVSSEKQEFDVVMLEIGEKRISVIKAVHDLLHVGLRDAKTIVDSAPTPIKEFASLEEAKILKYKLEAVGATIEIK